MTNKDDLIDGTIETLATEGLTKKDSEVNGRQREHFTDVGRAGHFATDNHGNDIDDDYDDGGAASEYKVGGGGAGVAGGNDAVGDGDEYDIGGHGNGESSDHDDHVVGDSGFIGDGCNGDRGGVGGGHVDKGDDKGRNGALRSENSVANGIVAELNSDHELVATENYSEEAYSGTLSRRNLRRLWAI